MISQAFYACTVILTLPLSGHSIVLNNVTPLGNPTNFRLDFTHLTAKNGYTSEEHTVITEDDYILTIFRITKAKRCQRKKKQPPVLFMHGLVMSADSIIDSGPDSGLAYLLADACYDIWLGNQRGNYYSRSHRRFNPDKDRRYWNFSIEEFGKYDVSATIDYVLNHTGAKKLNYIGFSQGAGSAYVMCSERSGFCNKIQLLISLAPSTRHLHTKSRTFRSTMVYAETFQGFLGILGIYELTSRGGPVVEFFRSLCPYETKYNNACGTAVDILDSPHHGSITIEALKALSEHFPAGTSVKNMAWFGQGMRSLDFVKFDYGKRRNLEFYGVERPPSYNLSAVTVPVVIMYGRNDGIVDLEDVMWVASKLPNVLELVEVDDPLWRHLDFTYSYNTKKLVFPKVDEYLKKYSHYDT